MRSFSTDIATCSKIQEEMVCHNDFSCQIYFEKWRKKIFGGKSALMISYLLEAGEDITEEELLQIQELIEQAKRKGKL